MAQIDARAEKPSPTPGRFQRLGSIIGAFLDRLLSPSVVALGFVILAFFIIRTGFEMHRYYQSLEVETIENESDDLWQQIYSNLGIEVLSIAVTVIVIERLNRREAERERKEELILQLGSRDNGFAFEAARRLSAKGWGFSGDTSLVKANLASANLQTAVLNSINLQGAFLREANLQSTKLGMANLQNTNFFEANLQGAFLAQADLQNAKLTKANLQRASLLSANMQAASFFKADLQGANFTWANLKDARLEAAKLEGAKFDEFTTLPDGTNWTPDRDLRQFTDPDGWAAGKYKSGATDAP